MAREIARQTFLRGALGAVAGGLVSSCRSAANSPVPPPSRTSPAISGPHGWSSLDDAIDGTVVLPTNDQYDSAKAVFNARFAISTPVAVVTVKPTDDVRKAVAFAAGNGIKVAPRSRGHSYTGASTANGAMVVDLRQLPRGLTVDDERALATISPAAELDSVQTELAAKGRSIPSGSCPSVGVGGLTLGGGLGADARSGRCAVAEVAISESSHR